MSAATGPLYEQQGNPYAHPKNYVYKQARLCYGSLRWGDPPHGWFAPGGRFITSEAEAHAAAVEIDRLLTQARVLPNDSCEAALLPNK